MRKGILLFAFVFLLSGCGGTGQALFTNSKDDSNKTSNNSRNVPNPNSSLDKSNDPQLEKFVQRIHSPVYKDYLAIELESSEGVKVRDNRLVVESGRGAVGAHLINQVLGQTGSGFSLSGLFSDDFKQLDNRAKQLEVLTGRRIKSLSHYLKISVTDPRIAEVLLRSLWRGAGIRAIYPGLKGVPTGGSEGGGTPDLSSHQGYLYTSANGGLNIDALWAEGILGEGVTIVDVENDWNLTHEDLPPMTRLGERGSPREVFIGHGTAILGILGAEHNAYGVKGIAPSANLWPDYSGGGATHVASTMDGMALEMNPGDIYLFEYQLPGPTSPSIECGTDVDEQRGCVLPGAYSDIHSAIASAVASGLVVIEGSGNGSINLGDLESSFPGLNLNQSEPEGAIVVGASNGPGRQRMSWGNCGNRVDLYSWGEGVATASYPGSWGWTEGGSYSNDPNEPDRYYTNQFGGTSSAAAIIAGAAGLLQSYAKSQMEGKKYLTPEKLKEILIASGDSAAGDDDCRIGVQPKMDDAKNRFNDFWTAVRADYPELESGEEIRGERRRNLRTLGVGLICNLYDEENSDPSCPETAQCVLDPVYEVGFFGADGCSGDLDWCFKARERGSVAWQTQNCHNTRCLPIVTESSDYDCVAGAVWPSGLRLAKQLDFDGDGKADLVNWTTSNWQIDFSANELGAWDVTLSPPPITARWVWPVAEDYNSDGRTDISVYDKEHGIWYIKFTDRDVLNGTWDEWDRVVTLPYRDELRMDVRQTAYGRPVPGDYNNDGFIDLAIARSDGIWSIDHGGLDESAYGAFDENINYLTPAQLAEAPGWAYLPVMGSGVEFKVPDGVEDSGELFAYSEGRINNENEEFDILPFGGNDSLPFAIDFLSEGVPSSKFSVKKNNGTWQIFSLSELILESIPPDNIYGGLDCHPFVADFDGDGQEDRAVQCPTEFRIGLSSTDSLLTIPLGYNRRVFSLPGKPYFGSVSYATTQRLLDWQRRSFPTRPPVIPVDMVSSE